MTPFFGVSPYAANAYVAIRNTLYYVQEWSADAIPAALPNNGHYCRRPQLTKRSGMARAEIGYLVTWTPPLRIRGTC